MTFQQKLSKFYESCRKNCKPLPFDEHLMHMELGVSSELGEVSDLFKKKLAGNKPIDPERLEDEWADVLWYTIQTHPNEDDSFLRRVAENVDIELNLRKSQIASSLVDADYYLKYKHIFDTSYERLCYTLRSPVDLKNGAYNIDLISSCVSWIMLGFALKINVVGAMRRNIDKLAKRYKDGFTDEEALKKRDKHE